MSLTAPKNLSAVSLTPVNSFSAVSLTLVNNLGFLAIFDGYQGHQGKLLLPVSLILAINCETVSTIAPIKFPLAINCIDDRGMLFLQNFSKAAHIVIGKGAKAPHSP